MKGRLIIISAPSGTGKTSVIQRFLATHPGMIHSISCTTRPMRLRESADKDYHFVTEEIFKRMIEAREFAEHAFVHNYWYGTPRKPLEEALKQGKEILLDLDVQGGLSLKKMFGARAVSIFLLPPSVEELERRLNLRGTDSQEVQKIRLENAKKEITFKNSYDHQVINGELEEACREIERILHPLPNPLPARERG